MVIWLLSITVWLSSNTVSSASVFITLVATTLSSNFYGNFFDRQNYNVYGWAFLPIVFWGLITGNIWLGLIFATLIATLSITVFVFVCVLVFSIFIVTKDGNVLLIPFLGIGFYLLKIKNVFERRKNGTSNDGFLKALSKLLEFVSGHGNAVLLRPSRWLASTALTLFFLAFPVAVYFSNSTFAGINNAELTFISLVPVCLVFLNQSRLFRFADVQSVLMFFLTVSSGVTLMCNHPVVFLAFYFANTNGIVSMVLFGNDNGGSSNPFAAVPVAPISTAKVQSSAENFLRVVPTGERILCVFRDPCGNYNNLFSGQYPLNEVLYYAGQIVGKPVFPDFYLAMSRDASLRWGTENIEYNLDQFSTDYFVVTETSSMVEKNENFTTLEVLNWEEIFSDQGSVATLPDPLPNWFLMKRAKAC